MPPARRADAARGAAVTGIELNKLRWALRLLSSGRVNDAREELEELAAAAVEYRPGLLSLRGPDAAASPALQVIDGKRA